VPARRNRIKSGITATGPRIFFSGSLIITAQGKGGDSNAFACPERRLILVRSEAVLLRADAGSMVDSDGRSLNPSISECLIKVRLEGQYPAAGNGRLNQAGRDVIRPLPVG
jgi:hypothetical protein